MLDLLWFPSLVSDPVVFHQVLPPFCPVFSFLLPISAKFKTSYCVTALHLFLACKIRPAPTIPFKGVLLIFSKTYLYFIYMYVCEPTCVHVHQVCSGDCAGHPKWGLMCEFRFSQAFKQWAISLAIGTFFDNKYDKYFFSSLASSYVNELIKYIYIYTYSHMYKHIHMRLHI